jgi:hypothetical protein
LIIPISIEVPCHLSGEVSIFWLASPPSCLK